MTYYAITVESLKKSLSNDVNELIGSCTNYVYYNFLCKNSRLVYLDKQTILEGYLCLHKRNYKPILVDYKNDWIYLEFLNFNNSDQPNKLLKMKNMLNKIKIKCFNVIVECIKVETNNDQEIKLIYCLQIDLTKCETISFEQINANLMSEENRLSIQKTNELAKLLAKNDVDPKKDNKMFYYLFKVVNIGLTYSLTNSQFKAKLRADIKIEISIIENDSLSNYEPKHIIMALVGKFLFYYPILHLNKYYLIQSKNKLNINFELIKKNNLVPCKILKDSNSLSDEILFIDNDIYIIDDYKLSNNLNNYIASRQTQMNQIVSLNQPFIGCLNGILVEKKLQKNGYHSMDLNLELMHHFDLVLSNTEYKLVIKVNDAHSNIEEFVTVFFNTRFSLHQLSVLPGMNIQIHNLIKKSNLQYKSNTTIEASCDQPYDFINYNISCENTSSEFKKKSLYESLVKMNSFYNTFYTSQCIDEIESIDDERNIRFSLLFKKLCLTHSKHDQAYKIFMAQILQVLNLNLKIKCATCNSLANSCCCSTNCLKFNTNLNNKSLFNQIDKYKIELNVTFLIDDHTSTLKVTYSDMNYKLKASPIFSNIQDCVYLILIKYLNEINIASIPLKMKRQEINDEKVLQEMELNLNNTTLNRTNMDNLSNDDHIFENKVKIDIHKTLYDHLHHSLIEKYFLFYINVNEIDYMNVMKKLKIRSVINRDLFKLSDLNSQLNLQQKSISIRCSKFKSIDEIDES